MASLIHIDGREVRAPLRLAAEVVVVGSGPAGATVAAALAARGVRVLVLEEGHWHPPETFLQSGVRSMANLYRDMGTSIALGDNPMPYLQGRAVGGTSVVNGAICWEFPEDVHAAWLALDPALADAIPLAGLRDAERGLSQRLSISPTEPAVAGRKAAVMAAGADRLGLAHRPIRRNVVGCQGSGRCLQGCPHGAKLSMDRSLLPDAVRDGARIAAGVRVDRVLWEPRGAYGVAGVATGGGPIDIRASHGVVLAASAIQTPVLLLASGIRHGPVGAQLSGHPGVSVTGRFAQPVDNDRGATQGHEVTGLRHEGLKLETLGFDRSILASRVPGVGAELARRVDELAHYAVQGAAIRAEGRGTVRPGPFGPRVHFPMPEADVRKARLAVRRLGELLLAGGAEEVYPGIAGFDPVVRDPGRMAEVERDAPLDPKAYPMSVTHLFGTCAMGSDPSSSVVRPDFRHQAVPRLWVADSSVFPSNLGVNPMLPIMAMATLCAARIAE